MIRAVIFDCFGVLYTDGKSQIIEACPPDKRQTLGDLFMQTDYGFISGDEFTKAVAELLGMNEQQLKTMTSGLYSRNEQLLTHVRRYKQQFKIGLLSNVSEELFMSLFSPGDQAELFDTVVLSSREGIIKPSAAIYLKTAARLGVQPDEAVMIDDVEQNVEGAKATGMHGIQYTSIAQTVETIDALLASKARNA